MLPSRRITEIAYLHPLCGSSEVSESHLTRGTLPLSVPYVTGSFSDPYMLGSPQLSHLLLLSSVFDCRPYSSHLTLHSPNDDLFVLSPDGTPEN